MTEAGIKELHLSCNLMIMKKFIQIAKQKRWLNYSCKKIRILRFIFYDLSNLDYYCKSSIIEVSLLKYSYLELIDTFNIKWQCIFAFQLLLPLL
jgi:hypothetical protein